MPQFSNIHALLDNEELHPPRDFSLAHNNTSLGKDPMGQLAWMEEYWQRPVLGLVDYTDLPNSPNHGDRYVIVSNGSTAMDTTAIDSTAIDTTAIDSTAISSSGIDTGTLPDELHWNDIVQYFSTDNDGNAVEQWVGISPAKGYRLHDLSSNSLYHFNGSVWQKDRVEGGAGHSMVAQEYLTRQQLLDLKVLNKLEPGVRYYITDRDIILTATTGSELSIEGDHTRAISAYGYFDFYDLWTSGSVNSVTVNGVEVLEAAVSFDTDIYESVIQLCDTINDHLDLVGYWILDAGTRAVFIKAPEEGRSTIDITVTINGSTFNGDQFFQGHDVGELWFKVRYDIENDHIHQMSDHRGNVVRYDPERPIIGGDIDPYFVFPWGHANVTNNTVQNGALMAYTATGTIANNIVDHSLVRVEGYMGDGLDHNKVLTGSQLQAILTEGLVTMNTLELGSALLVSGTKGHVAENHIFNGFVNALGSNLKGIGVNKVRDTQLNLENYGEESEVLYNSFDSCSLINLASSIGDIKHSHFKDSEVNGVSGNLNMLDTVMIGSTLSYFNSTLGSELSQVRIEKQSTIDLNNAFIRLKKSNIESSTVTATNADVLIEVCTIKDYSELNMSNAVISSFSYNDVSNTNWTLTNANTVIERNQINYTTLNCSNYTGAYFRGNRMVSSSVGLGDSSSKVYNNLLESSSLNAVESTGDIGLSQITSNSSLEANRFTGAKCIFCDLQKTSELNINDLTSEVGRIRLTNLTKLLVDPLVSSLYIVDMELPEQSVYLNTSQTSLHMRTNYSSLLNTLILTSDYVTLGGVNNEFIGELNIDSSGVLNEVVGVEFAVSKFIIRPTLTNSISIDSSTSRNIVLPSTVAYVSLNGSNNDSIEVVVKSGSLYVVSINQY